MTQVPLVLTNITKNLVYKDYKSDSDDQSKNAALSLVNYKTMLINNQSDALFLELVSNSQAMIILIAKHVLHK